MKTSDKTIYKNMSLCSFGNGANLTAVDSKDGKIVRMRPVHYDEHYTPEDLNAWKIEATRQDSFEPGFEDADLAAVAFVLQEARVLQEPHALSR